MLGYAELANNITNTLMLLEYLKAEYLSPEFRLWISWDPHANNVTLIYLIALLRWFETVILIRSRRIGNRSQLFADGEYPLLLL